MSRKEQLSLSNNAATNAAMHKFYHIKIKSDIFAYRPPKTSRSPTVSYVKREEVRIGKKKARKYTYIKRPGEEE